MYQRREWLICIILFGIGFILALLLAPLHLDSTDDGFYMYQTGFFMQGGLPYRDFVLHDAPLGNLWQSLLLFVFGRDALILRLGIVPFKAILLPLVYLLTHTLTPRGPAIVAALMVPVMNMGINYYAPHVALNTIPCVVGAVGMLMLWNRYQQVRWIILAGALVGLAASFKQNMGLYLLAGTGLWLLEPFWATSLDPDSSGPTAKGGVYLRILAWSIVLVGACWLIHDHPEPSVIATLIIPLVILFIHVLLVGRPQKTSEPLRPALMRLVALGSGFSLTVLPWFVWYAFQLDPITILNGLFIVPAHLGDVWFSSLALPTPRFWLFLVVAVAIALLSTVPVLIIQNSRMARWAIYWPWIAMGLSLMILAFPTPLRDSIPDGINYILLYHNIWIFYPAFIISLRLTDRVIYGHLRLLLLTSGLFSLSVYPRMREPFYVWILPLFLPLAAWIFWQARELIARRIALNASMQIQSALLVVSLLIPILIGQGILRWWAIQYIDITSTVKQKAIVKLPLVGLNIPHTHLLATSEEQIYFQHVLQEINTRTKPGEPIYSFLRQPILYSAAERPAAVTNPLPIPGLTLVDGIQMRDELLHSGVRLAVLDPNTVVEGKIVAPPGNAWTAPIVQYLNDDFHPIYVSDYGSIWLRKAESLIPEASRNNNQ